MVLEIITIDVQPGRAAEFIAGYSKIAALVRQATDCTWNRFVQVSESRFISSSEWADQESIDEFISSPQFLRLIAPLGALFATPPSVEKGEVIV